MPAPIAAKWIQRQDLAAAKVTQLSMAIAMMVTALASGVLRILALEDGEIVAHSTVCPHWRGQLFGRAGGVCVSGAGLRGAVGRVAVDFDDIGEQSLKNIR
jgi:nitrite reductase/ring-hydroxylating ferredoxin subunit